MVHVFGRAKISCGSFPRVDEKGPLFFVGSRVAPGTKLRFDGFYKNTGDEPLPKSIQNLCARLSS
jgi:hypothetical protein